MICGLAHQPYEMATRAGLLERLPIDYIHPDLQHGIAKAMNES
jgi:SulP family sulfate permease